MFSSFKQEGLLSICPMADKIRASVNVQLLSKWLCFLTTVSLIYAVNWCILDKFVIYMDKTTDEK